MDGAVVRRLDELAIVLPAPFGPVGEYEAAARAGDLLFLSGTGPVRADGELVTGKVGADGCSQLLVDVLGPSGRGARSAIGVAELPFDIAVEIEAVVQLAEGP